MTFQRNSGRRGVSAVEFAVVLPLIVLLLLGAIEIARGVMVAHALQEAAQAGCRVYSVQFTSLADANAMIDAAMTRAGVTNYTVAFNPKKKSDVDKHMEPVTVTVSVPFANVAWLPPNYLAGAKLEGKSTMPADLKRSDGGDQNGYSILDDDNDSDGNLRTDDVIPDDDD